MQVQVQGCLACRVEQTGVKPPTFQLVGDLLYILSHSNASPNILTITHTNTTARLYVCASIFDSCS